MTVIKGNFPLKKKRVKAKKLEWVAVNRNNKEDRILGKPCLVRRKTYSKSPRQERDLILPGKYGAIWEYNDTEYFVLIVSAKIANRYLGAGFMTQEDEHGFVCDAIEARKWIPRLKISSYASAQLKAIASW